VRQAKDFLSGKSSAVQADLERQMAEAAERLDFETAAMLRDRLRAATFIQGSQAINAQGLGDADIFALASRGGQMSVQTFFIRGGQNWGHRALFPRQTADVDEAQVLANVILQFYEDVPPPPTILVDRELPEAALIEAALSDLAGRKVRLSVPARGERRKLMAQAQKNAVEALERRLAETGTKARLNRELAEFLELDAPPQRIEVYDNSHIQGDKAVGAMIVAGPEGFEKGQYRKFNIRAAKSNDDFAMLREVIARRFRHFAPGQESAPGKRGGHESVLPDLILIDGGKGQVSSVMAVLEELGLADEVAVVGIAKGPHHGREGREVFHFPDGREKTLAPNAPLLFHLQNLRDEVHRYAIGAHRARRSRAIAASPLDEIPGIGPARKRALLLHFGTASRVRAAALEDLQRAPGISAAVARRIYDFYHAGG
jgi:excinuclease ABC subunit C